MRTIYFVSGQGAIKIGSAENVQKRLKRLQASSGTKLSLIGVIEGGFSAEFALHRRLRKYRVRGEWFVDCDEVRAVLRLAIDRGLSAALAAQDRERTDQNDRRTTDQCKRSKPASPDKVVKPVMIEPGIMTRALNLLWPSDATKQLHRLTGASIRTCSSWVSGASEPRARIAREIIRSDYGMEFLRLVLDGHDVHWWEKFKGDQVARVNPETEEAIADAALHLS